jgi:hypothetical protein
MDVGKLERQIDDMDNAYHLKTKPSVHSVYDPSFLPPAEQRGVLVN